MSFRIAARSSRLVSAAVTISPFQPARCVPAIMKLPTLTQTRIASIAQRRAYTFGNEAFDPQADGPGSGRFINRGPHMGPSGSPLAPTLTLYVGNLQYDVTAEELKQYFSGCGEISESKIILDARGLSKGFGYITFVNQKDATTALEMLNNSIMAGRRLNVQYVAKQVPNRIAPNPPCKTLFIGNMNYEMTDDDINELFKGIKNCIDIRVAMDRRTGQPRGFAHADFVDVESALAAKEKLSGRIFFGRALRIDFADVDSGPIRRRDGPGGYPESPGGYQEGPGGYPEGNY